MQNRIRNPKLVKKLRELEKNAAIISAIINTVKSACIENDYSCLELTLGIAEKMQDEVIEKISELYY